MRVALLDARQGKRDPRNSITVAYRNLITLASYFKGDLYVSADQLKKSRDDYDIIICGFGSTSTERHASTDFLNKNKKSSIFWLVGEYEQTTFAPLFYSKREFCVIKNFEHNFKNKMAISQHFLNINLLLADECKVSADKAFNQKKYGAIYYGRWREGRERYFKKYLSSKDIFLSTSPKNRKKYISRGCNCHYMPVLSWKSKKEQLGLFAASIYLEDEFTHDNYNCPANRYYEALATGTINLFQSESKNTWMRYEKDGVSVNNELFFDSQDHMLYLAGMLENKSFFMDCFDRQKEESVKAKLLKKELLGNISEIFNESCKK